VLLGGGFESGIVTQLYGEAGSGKTNICLQLAIECARKEEKVIFIDSEGFSAERFMQIAGEDAESIAKRIIIYEPQNFEQQASSIKETETLIKESKGKGKSEIVLVILDSATLFYRLELDDERSMHLRRELANQIAHLSEIARRYNITVVITNQVYMDIESGELRPIGGYAFEHLSKVIVQLERIGNGKRRATVKKHRSMPEDTSCEFFITSSGVEDVIR
jgi:DNA repair protein RadB